MPCGTVFMIVSTIFRDDTTATLLFSTVLDFLLNLFLEFLFPA